MIRPECISAYVIRKTEEGLRYLLLRRCSPYLKDTWQMVSGKIEPGETAKETALREIIEETGIKPKELHSADIVETFYMPSKDRVMFVPVFFTVIESNQVSLSPDEHDAYEWLSFEEAKKKLLFLEQKRAISAIHRHLNPPMKKKEPLQRTGVYGYAEIKGCILITQQQKGPHAGNWDLPGGGIEVGESIEKALRRECLEEACLTFQSFKHCVNISERHEELQRIALVYCLDGVEFVSNRTPELPFRWEPLDQVDLLEQTDLLKEVLKIRRTTQQHLFL